MVFFLVWKVYLLQDYKNILRKGAAVYESVMLLQYIISDLHNSYLHNIVAYKAQRFILWLTLAI